jgi:hypothetical protein
VGVKTLSDEQIAKIIRDDAEAYAKAEEAARAERLTGRRCMCCDEPLPAGHAGDECATCADLPN